MLKLTRPTLSARDVFATCISRIRSQELKEKLFGVMQDIEEAAAIYLVAAEAQALHQITQNASVAGVVTTAEMEAVYTDRMAKKDSPGRSIYDEIFAAANGRCPLCGHRIVSTLDHLLPKAHYPALAVSPINLVPACSDCNKAKRDSVPLSAEDVPLHPYFDDVVGHRWLYAEVLKTAPASARFSVNPPPALDALRAERLRRHFAQLRLSLLYGSEAAEELLNIRHSLCSVLASGGAAAVRQHLKDQAESRLRGRLNGWRGAVYEAWAESDWFCGGGFADVG